MSTDPYRNLDVPDEEDTPLEAEEELLPGEVVFEENEVDDGYSPARLCYVMNFLLVPFCLIPYRARNNGFSLFHAKQALALWIGLMGSLLLGMILFPFGILFWLLAIPGILILNYQGLRQVTEEKAAPLPLIKKHPQGWFQADVSGEDDE